jgi:tRNA pseudouridine32 synthase/23S rRNA pseudouridine746 synthase
MIILTNPKAKVRYRGISKYTNQLITLHLAAIKSPIILLHLSHGRIAHFVLHSFVLNMNNPLPFFNLFDQPIASESLPALFTNPFDTATHPLCLLAVEKVQHHLTTQSEWNHNFGLSETTSDIPVIGKMFGVLIVKTETNEIGFLAAFSGKLAGGNHHDYFVPPVFDLLTDGGFLNTGMEELSRINKEIESLKEDITTEHSEQISLLKNDRKEHSHALQQEIFNHYFFLNNAGEEKSLMDIFKEATRKNPPSGAGECAAPKLLQYAFLHNLQPLAIAEFWWGQSPKSTHWKHGHFYPSCQEKCAPILAHMLKGIEMGN